MFHQAQVPLGNLPVQLILLQDGTLVFIRVSHVGYILDQGEVSATFTDEGFIVGNLELWYNTIYSYKDKPELLQWLKQQQLLESEAVIFA
jgi:hypothetical protein